MSEQQVLLEKVKKKSKTTMNETWQENDLPVGLIFISYIYLGNSCIEITRWVSNFNNTNAHFNDE